MKCWGKGIRNKTVTLQGYSVEWTFRSAMLPLTRCPSLLLLLVLLVHPDPMDAGLEKRCNLEDRLEGPAAGGLCGERIPEVIGLQCMFRRPRRSSSSIPLDGQNDFSKVKLDKSAALSYLLKRNIGDQGIVCECCYNVCTASELLQYC